MSAQSTKKSWHRGADAKQERIQFVNGVRQSSRIRVKQATADQNARRRQIDATARQITQALKQFNEANHLAVVATMTSLYHQRIMCAASDRVARQSFVAENRRRVAVLLNQRALAKRRLSIVKPMASSIPKPQPVITLIPPNAIASIKTDKSVSLEASTRREITSLIEELKQVSTLSVGSAPLTNK